MLAIVIACGPTSPTAMQAPPLRGAPDDGVTVRLAEITRGFEIRDEQFAPAGQPPIALRFVLKPETAARAQRLIDATKSALARLGEWHGPFPRAGLQVIDAPWNSPWVGASYPGVVVTAARMFEPESDRSLERTLIGAIARQYWEVPAGSEPARQWLGEGLALYAGVRGIHEELEGRHFASARLFGGFVPFTSRSLQWSHTPTDPRPQIRHFAEIDQPAEAPWRSWSAAPYAEAQRVALALHTLERYLGWPAMQQVLEAFQARWRSGAAGPGDLASVIGEQRGRDVRWFFDEALRFEARFDYGILAFSSEPAGPAPAGTYETRVSLRRFGDGVFAGTSEPAVGAFANARSLLVVTRFDDGSVVEDWWDGRTAELDLTYQGPSRAISTSVDPDAVLLLDEDRSNNSRTLTAAMTPTGARLVASWFLWLQDAMLASTALL